jgi:NodT family efflux transporter outer membrane factor (OMF) lipoprotein
MPSLHLPASWSTAKDTAVATDAKSTTEQKWWKHFHDPVLDQLIAKALAGNIDYKIATARIEQARATRASARADLLPVVNTEASAEREANQIAFGGDIPGIKKPFSIYETGFDASWELDVFGGRRRALESAKAELQAASASRDAARVSVLAEVARTYVDIRQYQQQLAITQDTITSQNETLRIAKERAAAGTVPGLDVTQAHAELTRSQSQLSTYQNMLAQDELSLDVLLGEQPGTAQAIVGAQKPIPVASDALVLQAPASVIANRPDIREAERNLASATAQQGVATAQLFPDLSLSGFVGFLSGSTDKLIDMTSKSWSVGGNVLWPILNFNKVESGIDLANAQQKEAYLDYQKAVITALSDVERSVSAYTKEDEHDKLLHATTQEDKNALDVARMRYKEGLSSFLEVLDAERTLYASQSAAVAADGQTSQNLIAVYKSLGGGWKDVPKPAPATPSAASKKAPVSVKPASPPHSL